MDVYIKWTRENFLLDSVDLWLNFILFIFRLKKVILLKENHEGKTEN